MASENMNTKFQAKALKFFVTLCVVPMGLIGCNLPQAAQQACQPLIDGFTELSGGPINYQTCSQLFSQVTSLIACAENACASGGDVAVAALSEVIAANGEEEGAALLLDAAESGLIVSQGVISAAYGGEQAGPGQSTDGPACTIDWKIVCEKAWKEHKSKYYKCKEAGFTPAVPEVCQPYINPEAAAGLNQNRASAAVVALD